MPKRFNTPTNSPDVHFATQVVAFADQDADGADNAIGRFAVLASGPSVRFATQTRAFAAR